MELSPIKGCLKNGLRFILTSIPQARSVAVNILVATGARHEDKEINGISHFLEHLVFKGTKDYPNQVSISESVEAQGGLLNAYTSSQVTSFWAKTPPDHWPQALRVLADLVRAPRLRPRDIEREKGVIIEEIRMKNDNPADEVMELAQHSLWGGRGLGLPVLGGEATIRSLSGGSLRAYFEKHYQPEKMVVSLAGAFDQNRAQELLRQEFSFGRPRPVRNRQLPTRSSSSRFVVRRKKTAQSHLVLAFPTFAFADRRRFALELISSILGQGMSSRLFLKVRDKGLAYAIHCFADFYPDTGAFFTYGGIENERLPEALGTILNEFRSLRQEKLTPGEMGKAYEKIRGPLLFSLENPIKVAEFFGYQEAVFGSLESPEVYLENLKAVSPAEIREVSAQVFSPQHLSLSAISPFAEKELRQWSVL